MRQYFGKNPPPIPGFNATSQKFNNSLPLGVSPEKWEESEVSPKKVPPHLRVEEVYESKSGKNIKIRSLK
jgi:hypothetical protein